MDVSKDLESLIQQAVVKHFLSGIQRRTAFSIAPAIALLRAALLLLWSFSEIVMDIGAPYSNVL